jgi:thymidylate synthase (FAD)
MTMLPVALMPFHENPIKCLDHGFVQLLDVMGNDAAVEEAAVVSYQKGTIRTSSRRELIRYMMRNKHTSPFEQCEFKIRVKLPIVVERQMARHRTAGWNELSARYSELPEEFYIPELDQVCYQSTDNKQGRAGPVPEPVGVWFQDALRGSCQEAFEVYHQALGDPEDEDEINIARETARLGLPLNTYTMKVWKMDLKNLLHFMMLRCDPHAQWEIRVFAEAIEEIVKVWVPETYEAWVDYVKEAHTFSRQEMMILRSIVKRFTEFAPSFLTRAVWRAVFDEADAGSKRERGEFLKALGITLNEEAPGGG